MSHEAVSRNASRLPVWIWSDAPEASQPNARLRFSKEIWIDQTGEYMAHIAADSRYQLRVDDELIEEGPARFYPDSPTCDAIPLRLSKGRHLLQIEVLSFGVNTFQYVRGCPGLWAKISDKGCTELLVSDETWDVVTVPSHVANTPRISPQLGFEEQCDFTATQQIPRKAARTTRSATPTARSVPLCTRKRRPFQTIISQSVIRPLDHIWCIHSRELLTSFPGGANVLGLAGVFGAEIEAGEAVSLPLFISGGIDCIRLNGIVVAETRDQDLRTYQLDLVKGMNWLSISLCDRYDHFFELAVGCEAHEQVIWHAASPGRCLPWFTSGPLWTCDKDTNCPIDIYGRAAQDSLPFHRDEATTRERVAALAVQPTRSRFADACAGSMVPVPSEYYACADAYFSLRTDQVVETLISSPRAIGERLITLKRGERFIIDLGEVTNGYFSCDVVSSAPFTLDGCFVEYIAPEGGNIQYLQNDGLSYRNSFRCRFQADSSSFRSSQRRGGRYAILTLRDATTSVQISSLEVSESLYPTPQQAILKTSNERLDQIFRMSQRTLHLCMEDTFTDCPSYEQTLWVGDARNEMLFAGYTFGAYEMIEHCSRLISQSLRSLPMAACQCPSGWDTILPTFSFLWVLSLWESYQQTANTGSLREVYPAARSTLITALKYCTDHGLYSAPTWNFFDWAPVDQNQNTVLHNSLLLAAALEAGAKISQAIQCESDSIHYSRQRDKLIHSLNALWNAKTKSFPDALLPSGEPSARESQHTSILATLFRLIPDEARYQDALLNCQNPPPDMTRVGSPFAMFFLLESLMSAGKEQDVLTMIEAFWGNMLDAGSSTCWEMINPPGSEFPTRSHCHGWSAAPVYLLPRLFFGLEILSPGWRRVRLRPRLCGLSFVEASICTPHGPIILQLQSEPEKPSRLTIQASEKITLEIDHAGPIERISSNR